jgi:hypothetical protein
MHEPLHPTGLAGVIAAWVAVKFFGKKLAKPK